MKSMMRVLAGSVVALFLTVTAHAQDRVQVRAGAGWSGFGDEGIIGHSVAGVTADVRLAGGLRVGPEIVFHSGPGTDRDLTVIPLIGYDFRRSTKVVPFVNGGIGLLRHDTGRNWANSWSAGFGGGVKFAVTDRLFIAPEFRMGWEPVARGMISIGYRF